MPEGTFATAITCMDGRVIEPVQLWAKEHFGVDFVDFITEPGVDLMLTEKLIWQDDKIKGRLKTSIDRHGSRQAVIVGHYDCPSNAVSDDSHRSMIRKSVETILSWKLGIRVVGLWINESWQPEVVVDVPAAD
ncbi:MAG: hypothetical protein RBT76_00280 [candidate division Zixibacteria bacterium]|jgi:carbonic anhydrase|nr:hypothetical protein [candidate division Zixibacteria bacterium]